MTDASPILKPVTFGAIEARNRVVMAPLTRNRSTEDRVPHALNTEYYRQRAGFGVIVTEATIVSPQGAGYLATPGIYNDEQVAAWKEITDAVHEEGGTIVLQLWHVGRVSHTDFHDGNPPVGPTAVNANTMTFTTDGFVPTSDPRALATDEIPGLVQTYVDATRRAREAGFDGVEVHAANGYLLEQFLADSVNDRDDQYGGSMENRARLTLEVTDAVIGAWTADRVGIRLSLGNGTADTADSDPTTTLGYLGGQLQERGLAYAHFVEGMPDNAQVKAFKAGGWTGPVIGNAGYDLDRAVATIEDETVDAVAFGTLAIANPDLPTRFEKDAELNEPDDSTFYGGGAEGYTDYPFLDA